MHLIQFKTVQLESFLDAPFQPRQAKLYHACSVGQRGKNTTRFRFVLISTDSKKNMDTKVSWFPTHGKGCECDAKKLTTLLMDTHTHKIVKKAALKAFRNTKKNCGWCTTVVSQSAIEVCRPRYLDFQL